MSIQPTYTPDQQAVRDAIQAWREESDSPLTQAEWAGLGARCETTGARKAAPAVRQHRDPGPTPSERG